jgi:gluconate kinase
MIIVLFGQPHCGKSTLAKSLGYHLFAENIDGDNLRDIFHNKDYSREGRIRNLNRASDIAHYINQQNLENVILSLVYPYKEAREYLNQLTPDVRWVYLTYKGKRGREKFHVEDFEVPENEQFLGLDTSTLSIIECTNKILKYVGYQDSR